MLSGKEALPTAYQHPTMYWACASPALGAFLNIVPVSLLIEGTQELFGNPWGEYPERGGIMGCTEFSATTIPVKTRKLSTTELDFQIKQEHAGLCVSLCSGRSQTKQLLDLAIGLGQATDFVQRRNMAAR